MKNIFIVFVVLFLAASGYAQDKNLFEPENHCNIPGAWEEYEKLVRKYPNDKDVQILHALRIGLCVKISQGSIDLGLAIDIFDEAHKLAIEKAKSQVGKEMGEL